MLLEELATITNTTVNTEHATQITETDHQRNLLERIEQANRVPIVVYDTDWKDERTQPISTEYRSSVENAQRKQPTNVQFEQAKIQLPKSILSRERIENIEHTNQEITQPIDQPSIPQDRPIQRIETDTNLVSNQNQHSDTPQILCHPIDEHLPTNDEQLSSFSDDSLLVRHQQKSNVNIGEPTNLEGPVRSTAFLTLNYAQHNQDITPPWQRAFDQQLFDQSRSQQQQVQIQIEESSPRYLPSISSTENYISEFHQTPLLHENVRIQDTEKVHLVPSAQINQLRPIYRVRQQQISATDDHDYSPISSIQTDHIDRINTAQTDSHLIGTVHVEPPPPVTIDIELRTPRSPSDSSSLDDMETALNRYEENFEPEQHLPLVDQISLSYTTSLRSTQDGTQRAIERYEQEHPFFSRALPSEWLQPKVFPHDEQLVEQWIVEKNLETTQQQVELSTNDECENFVVVTAAAAVAIANDACSVDERFEEEVSNNVNTNNEEQNNQIPIPILASHYSPTSDYETDSLDKDNDTTSTTTSVDAGFIVTATPVTITLPTQSLETGTIVPVEYLLETLANEPKDKNEFTKDFLLTIGFGQQSKPDIHRAKENSLEFDDNLLLFNFDDNQQELLNIFFEPAHFHLPIVNEISLYQISFHHEYPIFSPSNLSEPIIHNDDHLSSNEYQTNEQDIFSIAQINHQSDHEENLEALSTKYDPSSLVEQYEIQPSENFFVHVNEPPVIMEIEDEQSAESVLPDVIPSTKQNEVMHGKGMPICMYIESNIINRCRMTTSIIETSNLLLDIFCMLTLLAFALY